MFAATVLYPSGPLLTTRSLGVALPTWFRESIKDDELAQEAEDIEADESLDARESRKRLCRVVESRYTLPGEEEPGTRTD
ncbi:hypothetical protein BH23ACT12_BH23ACT12_20980 [soil metagenome]